MYIIEVEDYDANIFDELKIVGAKFDRVNYLFRTKDKDVYDKSMEIVEFYKKGYELMTKGHRAVRTKLEDYNLDVFAKRMGDKLYFCNTNNLGDIKAMVKLINKLGWKVCDIINDYRIVVQLTLANN